MLRKTRGSHEPEWLLMWLVIHCVVSETRIANHFHAFSPERYKNCHWQSYLAGSRRDEDSL